MAAVSDFLLSLYFQTISITSLNRVPQANYLVTDYRNEPWKYSLSQANYLEVVNHTYLTALL